MRRAITSIVFHLLCNSAKTSPEFHQVFLSLNTDTWIFSWADSVESAFLSRSAPAALIGCQRTYTLSGAPSAPPCPKVICMPWVGVMVGIGATSQSYISENILQESCYGGENRARGSRVCRPNYKNQAIQQHRVSVQSVVEQTTQTDDCKMPRRCGKAW